MRSMIGDKDDDLAEPVEPPDSPSLVATKHTRQRWLKRLFTLVLLGVAVYLFLPLVGEIRLAANLFRSADWRFFVLAVVIQAISYCSYTGLNVVALKPFPGKIGFIDLMGVLAAMSFIQVGLPSFGVSSAALRIHLLGNIQVASLILVISLWTAIIAASFSNGGVGSSIFLGIVVLVFTAGMLLGDKAGYVVAAVSLITGLLMLVAESRGIIPPADANSLSRLLSYTFFVIMIMVFQRISSRTLRNALVKSQAELAERLRTEQALRLSEERYRLISSVSSDYMFSTQLGEDGNLHLSWVAGAFELITGYTYDEYVGRGGWEAALHPILKTWGGRLESSLKRITLITTLFLSWLMVAIWVK